MLMIFALRAAIISRLSRRFSCSVAAPPRYCRHYPSRDTRHRPPLYHHATPQIVWFFIDRCYAPAHRSITLPCENAPLVRQCAEADTASSRVTCYRRDTASHAYTALLTTWRAKRKSEAARPPRPPDIIAPRVASAASPDHHIPD